MPDRRPARSLLAVLALVSLVLMTVDYRQGEEGPIAGLQRGVLRVFAPLQEGLASLVQPIGGFVSALGELGSLREQNAALQEDLRELRERVVSEAELRRENAELRAQLEMRERLGFTTTGAQVVARPPNAFDWSVLLDIGADQGLRPGMAVINEHGLVGKLTDVTAGNARVQLLASPSAGYVVRVADTGEEGLLSGRGTRPLQLELLDPEAEVAAEAEIVTRSFQGSTIPDGIPVGVVVTGSDPDAPPGRFLSVRPYVDFTQLNIVQVVLDAPAHPGTLDPDDIIAEPEGPRPPEPVEEIEPLPPGSPTASPPATEPDQTASPEPTATGTQG